MKYNKPYDQTNPNAGYVNGNPATNTAGSIPCGEGLEFPQREIVAVITAGADSGLDAPSNSDQQQLLRTVRSGLLGRYAASGTPDAIVIAPNPAVATLIEGMRFRVKVPGTGANTTTTPSLAVNSHNALLLRRDGSAPVAGDLIAGRVVDVEIDANQNARFVGPALSELAPNIPSRQLVHTGVAATGGAATATNLVVDVAPNITAYEQGALYTITTALASANGGTTANFDALGTRPVKRADGTAIQTGDWGATAEIVLVDNGAELRLVGFSPTAVAQSPIGKGLFTDIVPGSRSWTVPAGVYWGYATCVGAGAGGTGVQNGDTRNGAGGGAGGTAAGWIAVIPGQVISYVVGAGSAGVAYRTMSANGGSSSISNLFTATGGLGTNNSGLAGGAGGVGSGGQLNLIGGAGTDGNALDARNPAGNGGASSLGGGGRASTDYIPSVSDGRAAGSGGGGTYQGVTSQGGNGAPGYVSFQY